MSKKLRIMKFNEGLIIRKQFKLFSSNEIGIKCVVKLLQEKYISTYISTASKKVYT